MNKVVAYVLKNIIYSLCVREKKGPHLLFCPFDDSSGFFSLVYWDHDGDDILQGNHITVGQRRKKETGRKVRGIDIDQEEDSLFLLCCLM
jgi:hypothetical protein